MITAIVRYRLPVTIDRNTCRRHFWRIAPGFSDVPGLISTHFIWSPEGTAGGVYVRGFRRGLLCWPVAQKRIVDRSGVEPTIKYFEVFSITDNAHGVVCVPQAA